MTCCFIKMRDESTGFRGLLVEECETWSAAYDKVKELQTLNPLAYYYLARPITSYAKDRRKHVASLQTAAKSQSEEHSRWDYRLSWSYKACERLFVLKMYLQDYWWRTWSQPSWISHRYNKVSDKCAVERVQRYSWDCTTQRQVVLEESPSRYKFFFCVDWDLPVPTGIQIQTINSWTPCNLNRWLTQKKSTAKQFCSFSIPSAHTKRPSSRTIYAWSWILNVNSSQ